MADDPPPVVLPPVELPPPMGTSHTCPCVGWRLPEHAALPWTEVFGTNRIYDVDKGARRSTPRIPCNLVLPHVALDWPRPRSAALTISARLPRPSVAFGCLGPRRLASYHLPHIHPLRWCHHCQGFLLGQCAAQVGQLFNVLRGIHISGSGEVPAMRIGSRFVPTAIRGTVRGSAGLRALDHVRPTEEPRPA